MLGGKTEHNAKLNYNARQMLSYQYVAKRKEEENEYLLYFNDSALNTV